MPKNIEKELDFAEYEIDEPEESKAAAEAAVNAAAAKVVKKAADADVGNEEESDVVKKLREDLAAAQLDAANAKAEVIAVKSAKKKRDPKGLYKAQCDDTMKKIKPTIKYIDTNHKGQHREMYMLGLFVKDFADALPENDDHDAFKKWLTDNKESLGLKKMTRKSTNATLNETIEESMDEDEDEEAGACAGSD
jgi:hypothetical protein